MATVAQIDAQAATQSVIVAEAQRELAAFWRTLPLDNPQATRDALMQFMPALVARYGDAAGVAAAAFYDTLRADAGASRTFAAVIAASDSTAVEAATRRVVGSIFGTTPETALVGLAAVIDKQVKQVYRDTITNSATADPEASGWHREIRGDTCKFCRMLASRGDVYKRSTAQFAAHHDCDCVAVPSWDANAPEVPARNYEASTRTSHLRELDAADGGTRYEDHKQRVHDYLEAFEG